MLPDIRLRIMGVESFQEAVRKANKLEESFCLRRWSRHVAAGILCLCSWHGLERQYGGLLVADRLGCHVQTLELGHE